MTKNRTRSLILGASLFLFACSSGPNIPDGEACRELQKTQKMMDKEYMDQLERILYEGGSPSGFLYLDHLSAYKGLADKYLSTLTEFDMKIKMSILLDIASNNNGTIENRWSDAKNRSRNILEWCYERKYL